MAGDFTGVSYKATAAVLMDGSDVSDKVPHKCPRLCTWTTASVFSVHPGSKRPLKMMVHLGDSQAPVKFLTSIPPRPKLKK